MQLIYIANARIPTEKAHGIQIMKTCEALAAEGISLQLWLPRRRNPQFLGIDPFVYYGVRKNFSISYLPCWDFIGRLDFLPGAGYFIQSRTFAHSIKRWLARGNFPSPRAGELPPPRPPATPPRAGGESLVFYSRDLSALVGVAAKKLPYFYEIHTIAQTPKKWAVELLKQARGIVAISQSLAEISKKYVPAKRVTVASDGVDLTAFGKEVSKVAARKTLGFPTAQKIAVYSGHLYEWKGAYVLAAASEYLDDNTHVYFVGGTKADIETFSQYCKKHHLHRIRILGQVAPSEVPLYLAAADVLVLPNSGKFEISRAHTSPLKLFEYMAARRPIVAADLPSIREILDESTAVFFTPDDPISLARKITAILSDSSLAERITAHASQAAQAYSWPARGRKITAFITTVLS